MSHSEENLDTSTMGMIAALDASGKGELTKQAVKWSKPGFEGGFSSPIADGDRIYQMDNTANLVAFDAETGRELWKKLLGSVQKASPVLADGKLYVGTESGKFYILKPHAEKVDILSEVELPPAKEGIASAGTPEPVLRPRPWRMDASILSRRTRCMPSGRRRLRRKPRQSPRRRRKARVQRHGCRSGRTKFF